MLDLRWIRENPEALDNALIRRGASPRSEVVLAIDETRRATQTRLQELQTKRRGISKAIGLAKGNGEPAQELMNQVTDLKSELHDLEGKERELDNELNSILLEIPNIPDEIVPEGFDESSNMEKRRVGEPTTFLFKAQDHVAIGESLHLMDFESAARMSGARFVVLQGALARLERGLAAFMLDLQTSENGYSELSVPFLVRANALTGTGQLPKFSDDLFQTKSDHWLIPTAEVPLTNLLREQIIPESDLPIRVTACTPCFRSEAGAAGQDSHGMIRQHQFSKVELVSIVSPEESETELERMTHCAEEVLRRLELPYRVIELCSGDLGFSARRTYDLEVWLPGQDCYREISSCSNCGNFQARRMNMRFRPAREVKGTKYVHTLNGSGLAVGRTLIAILENFQNHDGSVTIPEALRPWMNGQSTIVANGE